MGNKDGRQGEMRGLHSIREWISPKQAVEKCRTEAKTGAPTGFKTFHSQLLCKNNLIQKFFGCFVLVKFVLFCFFLGVFSILKRLSMIDHKFSTGFISGLVWGTSKSFDIFKTFQRE